MKALLSPAKKLDFTPYDGNLATTEPVFLEKADALAKKLDKVSLKKLKAMMSISDTLADLNKTRYASWNAADTLEQMKPAALAFNGDVYVGLDAPSWTPSKLEAAQDKIRIISGLYGILKPLDVIKPYRLEMGSRWQVTAKQTNLYKFWGNTIATQLEKEMASDELLVNLASAEYAKVILPHLSNERRVITAEFREFKNGEYKMIQVFVKKARGFMAKFIVHENPTTAEDLKQFSADGYIFDANLSTENKYIFTR